MKIDHRDMSRLQLFAPKLLVAVLAGLFSANLHAHSPHDVVKTVALSPYYQNDRTLFMYVFDELKKSVDGGQTWTILENGLDNTSALVSDIATAPAGDDEFIVFAATHGDGIYRSNDRGESWHAVNTGLKNASIKRLVLSPDFRHDLTIVAIPDGKGLFVSTDAGSSWREVARDQFVAAAVSVLKENNRTMLLAGTDRGDIFRTMSGLDDWVLHGKVRNAGSITGFSSYLADDGGEVIYIGTESRGLYRTQDRGESVEHVSMPPTKEREQNWSHITSVFVSKNEAGLADVYVTRWHDAAFVSTDGGDSWTKSGYGLKKNKQADEYETSHFYEIEVATGFSNHGIAFIAGFSGLFKTANGGKSWREMETRPARNIEGLAISPEFPTDRLIALATYDGGAYVSRDAGETWVNHNIGLPSTHLWDIAVANGAGDGMTLYAASNPAFLASADFSAGWTANSLLTSRYWRYVSANFESDSFASRMSRRLFGRPRAPFPTKIAISSNFDVDQTLFLGTRYKGVLKSTDSGATWTHPWTADDGWVSSLKISPGFAADGSVFAAVREQGFFVSNDGGEDWRAGNAGLSALAVNYTQLGTSVIAVSPEFEDDNSVYFGTADGLYLSTSQGRSWQRLRVTDNGEKEMIRAVGISPDFGIDGTVFASVKGRGLFKSTDRGSSFSPVAEELILQHKVLKLFRFSPDYSKDRTILAASAEDAFVSTDSGASWNIISRPIRYENNSDYISYVGGWNMEPNAASSALKIHRSATPGARAVFQFTGTGVVWYGPRSVEYGEANVYLDGEFLTSVEQHGRESTGLTEMFSIRNLPLDTHTLTIEVDTEENQLERYIAIDAFEVM